nr:unnamed protein product [Digitaria exilis]
MEDSPALGAADWSELPADILGIVDGKLKFSDLFRSAAVCSSWRSAARSLRRHGLYTRPQTPCLLYSTAAAGSRAVELYSLADKSTYTIPLPDPPIADRTIVGSYHGWLVTADTRSELHLLNPATGEQLALPSVSTIEQVNPVLDEAGNLQRYDLSFYDAEIPRKEYQPPQPFLLEDLRRYLYFKVVLSGDPSRGAQCTAACKSASIGSVRPDRGRGMARSSSGMPRMESIAARFRHWHHDPAIRYALMSDDAKKTVETPPQSPKNPLKGDGAGGSGETVRIVREIGGGLANWPMLTKTNYTQWALVMKLKMQARNLWDAIEPGGVSLAVPTEMVASLASKDSALAAWNAVKDRCVGNDQVQKAKAQRLHRQFENIRFADGEGVDDFKLRLQNIVAALETVGEAMSEQRVVEKLLRVVPKSLNQVAVAIQDASGRLRAAQECDAEDDAPPPRADGKLYLTKQQWEAQSRNKQRGQGSSAGSKFGKPRGRARRAPCGGGGGSSSTPGQKIGARECPTKPKNQAARLAQAEEDEPTLLMAKVSSIQISPATTNAVNTPPLAIRPSVVGAAGDADKELPPAFRPSVVGAPGDAVKSPPPATRPSVVGAPGDAVFAHLNGDGAKDDTLWYLDTGATNHMSGSRAAFSELDGRVVGTVRFGDGSVVNIEGRGTVLFACKNGKHKQLDGVYYIPRLDTNLISIHIEHGLMRIRDEQKRLLARVRRSSNLLYKMHLNIARPVCLTANRTDEAWRWHQWFGHISFQASRKLQAGDMVRGLPHVVHVDQVCESCLAGKQRRRPFPAQARRRADGVLDLVHGDICGPITPATPNDMSRFMWLCLLASKDQAPAAIRRFKVAAEVESGRKLKNGTVVGMARSMMKAKGLPGLFWGEAVNTAVYILNRSSTRILDGKTPCEAWHGERPAPHLKKLENRSTPMIFIGYETGSKAYRVYNPVDGRVRATRDVVFDEDAQWDWGVGADGEDGADKELFTVEFPVVTERIVEGEPAGRSSATVSSPSAITTPSTVGAPTMPGALTTPDVPTMPSGAQEWAEPVEFATPPGYLDDKALDINHDDDVPLRFRTLENLLGSDTPPGQATRVFNNPVFDNEVLMFASTEEPVSFKEAEKEECWRRAMEAEMEAIEENKT